MDSETKATCGNIGVPNALFGDVCLKNELYEVTHNSHEILNTETALNIHSNMTEVKLDFLENDFLSFRKVNISSRLNKVPNVLFNFKYLTELNLSYNSLEMLPEEMGNLYNLITLNLSFNKLNCLPRSLKHIQQLCYLDISSNKFCEVPDVLYFGLQSLKVLELSNNKIVVFDETPRCINTIIALGLSNNLFKKLPLWIFDSICQLQYLCTNGNPLNLDTPLVNYCVSGIFYSLQLINIENCSLHHNKLEILSYFKNLNVLQIGNKNFSRVKGKENYLGDFKMNMFNNSSKIKYLYMQNAHIPSLPSDFDSLKNIEVLDLSGNLLSWLPESFCNLFTLKILNLSSNELVFLPKNIDNLICLKEIHLGNNQLCSIPESLYNLSNLEFIDLYGNKLDKIEMNIFQNKNLRGIDLGLNFLHSEICDCCDCDNEIKEFYNCFKESFRKHFKCMDYRCDLQNLKAVIENSSDSRSNVSIESDSLSESEDSHLIVPQDSFLDENWEENNSYKHDEDELFDPNEIVKFEKAVDIWNVSFRDNYCPATHHVPSVLKYYFRRYSSKNNETVEDGQFDSD